MNESVQADWLREPDMDGLSAASRLLKTNPIDAIKRLEALAERGSPMSMVYIGTAFDFGNGCKPDPIAAEHWYARAASLGSVRGYYNLGRMYLKSGRFNEAKQAFEHAAARGYSPAQHFLGRIYYLGIGTEANEEKAQSLLESASARGNIFAKRMLAQILLRNHRTPFEVVHGVWLFCSAFIGGVFVALTEGFDSERLS